MAEKIEIEKPVVSSELAESFERNKMENPCVSHVISSNNLGYTNVPEYEECNNSFDYEDFDRLLARMYVLGYEVEKSKRYVLKLPVKDNTGTTSVIYRSFTFKPVYKFFYDDNKSSFDNEFEYCQGFTKAEIESNEDLNKLASVCELVEVED